MPRKALLRIEVVTRYLTVDSHFAAVGVVGVADDPVVGVVGRVGGAVGQRSAAARRRIRDRASQAIAHVIISVGDGGVRPRFLRQLPLIVVGIIGDARGIRHRRPLAVGPELVVVGRHDRVAAVLIHDVRQPVQRVVSIARRAEHGPRRGLPGDALPVAYFVVAEGRDRPVWVRDRTQAVQDVVAIADGFSPRRGHAALVAQNVIVVVWAWIQYS